MLIHSSASHLGKTFLSSLLTLRILTTKISGIKLLIVIAKRIVSAPKTSLLRKKYKCNFFQITSLFICTNFKNAYLSIKLFFSNLQKLLSVLCIATERGKPILSTPQLKMLLCFQSGNDKR